MADDNMYRIPRNKIALERVMELWGFTFGEGSDGSTGQNPETRIPYRRVFLGQTTHVGRIISDPKERVILEYPTDLPELLTSQEVGRIEEVVRAGTLLKEVGARYSFDPASTRKLTESLTKYTARLDGLLKQVQASPTGFTTG